MLWIFGDEKIITLRYPETTKQDMKHIDYLFIIIKDTGIGIPIDKWDDIFAAFSQAKTDTTRSFGGTGLGLAITRQIVKLIDGRIWVESFENIGTSFYLILPLKKIKNKSNISQNKFTISKKLLNQSFYFGVNVYLLLPVDHSLPTLVSNKFFS